MFSRVLFAIILSAFILNAQEFEVPKNYKLEKKEDYKPYENDVLAAIEYLETSPFDKNIEKRKEVNAFLLKWMTGVPYVKIEMNSYVLELTKKNKDFLMIFLGGWTRYALQNPEGNNKFDGNLAGIQNIINVYTTADGIKKDKKVEKLIKLQKKGELEKWLKETLERAE